MKPASMTLTKQRSSRRGFTLLQILLVLAVVSLLSAFLFGAFGQSQAVAQRAQCDVQIKAITMALDAFRQDNGSYPEKLEDLLDKKYLTDVSMLKCPSDPRLLGTYDDYYIMRSGRDSGELPILVCPLCATDSGMAIQGFKGRYTKHFATRPAELTAATLTTIKRPGKDPISGKIGMQLRGGDVIRTSDDGQAEIRFADGSVSTMAGGSEITVLQSFISGHTRAPLYTLIKQNFGDVNYRINHGSKFDVTTPTATAGALGTEFRIKGDSDGVWWLKVIDSRVFVTNLDERVIVTPTALPANTTDKGDNSPVTITNDWVEVGQEHVAEAATTTPPTTGGANATPTPAPKKKKKRWGHWRFFR